MARELEAVYEQGVHRPLERLMLPGHQQVRLTLEEQPPANGGSAHENSKALSWKSTEPSNTRSEAIQWLARESSAYAGEW